MSIVTFYCGDPKNAPKTTQGAHLGGNAILLWQGKLLLERRVDADVWGLPGGGASSGRDPQGHYRRLVFEYDRRSVAGSRLLTVYSGENIQKFKIPLYIPENCDRMYADGAVS